jgi:hypothetical protein
LHYNEAARRGVVKVVVVAMVDAVGPLALRIDDQQHILEALHPLVKNEGYETELVNSPRAVAEGPQLRYAPYGPESRA